MFLKTSFKNFSKSSQNSFKNKKLTPGFIQGFLYRSHPSITTYYIIQRVFLRTHNHIIINPSIEDGGYI